MLYVLCCKGYSGFIDLPPTKPPPDWRLASSPTGKNLENNSYVCGGWRPQSATEKSFLNSAGILTTDLSFKLFSTVKKLHYQIALKLKNTSARIIINLKLCE